MLLDITIVIPVKNEASLLLSCLNSIGKNFVKKIVVVDSSSTDSTPEIAIKFGAELINFKWDGCFPKKRNWFLRNHKPDTSWVMFLDADEFLTQDFKNELISVFSKNILFNGFQLNYTIYFMNKKMIGGYPLRKLALFKVGTGEYERIDEEYWSQLDMEIHEHTLIKGPIGIIKSRIDHKEKSNIEAYWQKHIQYANWEAKRFLKIKENSSKFSKFSLNQKIKYYFLQSPFIGPIYFIGSYILMGGFVNGYRGFIFSLMKSAYFTIIFCRIKEIEDKSF